MPEMDGFEVVAAMQGNPAWRAIPVVVSTSLGGAGCSLVDKRGIFSSSKRLGE
jgi:CheY-like chemotaxis protein